VSGRRVHHFTHLDGDYLAVSVAIEARPLPLTPAELAVARLVARGLDNAEIARHRQRSVRTIANQVAAIMRKLALSRRAQLGSFVLPPD